MMYWQRISSSSFRSLLLAAILVGAPAVQGCKNGDDKPAQEEDVGKDYSDADDDQDVKDDEDVADEEDEEDDEDVADEEDEEDDEDVADEEDEEDVVDEEDEEDEEDDCDVDGAPFGGGAGNAADPYQLCTPAHLGAIGNDADRLNRHYVLVRNIDMSEVFNFNIIGSGQSPFQGSFDGNNKAIQNLTIRRTADYVGLFATMGNSARVVNLTLEEIEIEGMDHVGGVVGKNMGGQLQGISVSGRVSGAELVGGITGYNAGGRVDESRSVSLVAGDNSVGGLVGMNDEGQIRTSYSAGEVEGTNNIGGLVGMNFDGLVENTYSTANVTGEGNIGGLVGANSWIFAGGIVNSYSAGTVVGDSNVGGLVGMELDGKLTNSYWDLETSGLATSAQGAGLSTVDFGDSTQFVGWNFSSIWVMGTAPDGETRPILKWQE